MLSVCPSPLVMDEAQNTNSYYIVGVWICSPVCTYVMYQLLFFVQIKTDFEVESTLLKL